MTDLRALTRKGTGRGQEEDRERTGKVGEGGKDGWTGSTKISPKGSLF